MKKVIAASIGMLAIFASIPALAQSLYIYPATAIAPRGTYQTVTAIVNGVNNKTVTWSVNNGATLDGANRYAVLWRVQTARKPETRARRIEQFVEMLARHEKLHP